MRTFQLFVCLLLALQLGAQEQNIQVGAAQTNKYLHLLQNKRVGLVVNHSSRIHNTHLVDSLLSLNIAVKKIFAPEHGFRGKADRGAHIKNGKDSKTGLPIVSLYGKNKKPTRSQLADVDVLVFDIQDVGVRFFTYISTMHYAMEAAAENNKSFVVLDRPNPLGDYIDGPVRQKALKSFVGMHPIPIVHGLTVAELAQMIKGENWIEAAQNLTLHVVPCLQYTHKSRYSLPVKPSPNLPNTTAIRLYPSLCFFEASTISVGRGTHKPFQQIGYPQAHFGTHTFVPKDIAGMQINPIQEGKTCFGIDLSANDPWQQCFTLKYVLYFYKNWKANKAIWTRPHWFDLLAGTTKLRKQLEQGATEAAIKASWQTELSQYKSLRKKYLLYKDFE